MLFGAGGSQTWAAQFTTTLTSARSPSIVESTLLIVCTSSKKRRVTFSYQTVNSSWPCVCSSGHSMSLPSSVIIACNSSTGAWTSSARYQRSARSTISSLVSASLNSSSLRSESFRLEGSKGSRVSPRPGHRAAVGRVLVVVGHFLVQQQVDQERPVFGERLLDRGRDLVRRLHARGRYAHALGELVEADHGVSKVERAGEGVVGEAALPPVLLHVQLEQLVAAV